MNCFPLKMDAYLCSLGPNKLNMHGYGKKAGGRGHLKLSLCAIFRGLRSSSSFRATRSARAPARARSARPTETPSPSPELPRSPENSRQVSPTKFRFRFGTNQNFKSFQNISVVRKISFTAYCAIALLLTLPRRLADSASVSLSPSKLCVASCFLTRPKYPG